jgi:hypothetical protein
MRRVVRTAPQDAGSAAAPLITAEAMVASIPQTNVLAMLGGGMDC